MAGADNLVKECEEKMKRSVSLIQQELAGIRTGRASAGLVEHLKVDYYGNLTPLKQMASVSVPDAKTIEIRPWDKNAGAAIEKAISTSDLKLAPQRQGDVIRLNLPPLTEERRGEFLKLAKKVTEDGRVAIRNVRHETNNKLKAAKDQGLSDDDLRKLTGAVQKLTDTYIAKVDELLAGKEREIRTI